MLALILAATLTTGPSSSQSPYVLPLVPGLRIVSILTSGDTIGGYRMPAIPDGLGAYDNGDGTFTLLVNHEIGGGTPVVRRHGGVGATISRWTIRKSDLAVLDGRDLVHTVFVWNRTTRTYDIDPAFAFNRFCSATLGEPGASYDAATTTGFNGRLFFNGEETGPSGHAFAHSLDGRSWELPRLGRAAWENQVPHNDAGLKTIVVGLDDAASGQVYVYIGTKTNDGTPVDRAGLTNGRLYGVKVAGYLTETVEPIAPRRFTLHDLGDVSGIDGNKLQDDSVLAGITAFQRPEDGAWDPSLRNDFYFATTAVTAPTRIWRLRFDDIDNPTAGGTVSIVFDQSQGPRMMDNLTITRHGMLYVQEDISGSPLITRIWRYDLATNSGPFVIATHDPARFDVGGTLTIDEESSGIIDATDILGPGWLLFATQAHLPGRTDLDNGGQLMAAQFVPRRRAVGR